MIELGHPGEPAGIAVFEMGAKHTGVTPAGRGPAVPHSLSLNGTLAFACWSLSWTKLTVPSPGYRGSPLPPQTAPWSGVCELGPAIATHGRDHVNPPFVDRFTQTPLVSSVRLKLIWT